MAEELGLDVSRVKRPVHIHRTYAGWQQLEGWVYSWILIDARGFHVLASCQAASLAIKWHRKGEVSLLRPRIIGALPELVVR